MDTKETICTGCDHLRVCKWVGLSGTLTKSIDEICHTTNKNHSGHPLRMELVCTQRKITRKGGFRND